MDAKQAWEILNSYISDLESFAEGAELLPEFMSEEEIEELGGIDAVDDMNQLDYIVAGARGAEIDEAYRVLGELIK